MRGAVLSRQIRNHRRLMSYSSCTMKPPTKSTASRNIRNVLRVYIIFIVVVVAAVLVVAALT
jgi:hypothetical protein